MRHFSGEFEGLRLLMADELDMIAGGDGEDTDDVPPPSEEPDIVVNGRRITSKPVPGFFDPIIINLPPDPFPQAAGNINVSGGCGTSQSEFNEALGNLSAGSAAAAALIAAAREANLSLSLIREDTTSDRDGYNPNTGVLSWDPFSAAYGTNYNGSVYTLSPTISLAHELVHWANPNLTEVEVMSVTNEIAKEMNKNTGTTFDTNIDRHIANGRYNTNDTDSATEGTRPACS